MRVTMKKSFIFTFLIVIIFTMSSVISPKAEYSQKSLLAQNNNGKLANSSYIAMEDDGPLEVVYSFPEQNASDVSVTMFGCIELYFNKNIAKGEAFNKISVYCNNKPQEFKAEASDEGIWINLLKNGELADPQCNSSYTVNIPKDAIVDEDGNTLEKDFILKFSTQKPVLPTGVKLSQKSMTLFIGVTTGMLLDDVLPQDTTSWQVTWSSSNPKVAKVEYGKVTPVSPGEAVITVKTVVGNYKDTCKVTVKTLDTKNCKTFSSNQTLGQNGPYKYAGIYDYNNLIIKDNVEITSSGISELVIRVKGTLILGKNATIRVRNGYYPDAPKSSISSMDKNYISKLKKLNPKNWFMFEGVYGKGGDGGNGVPGADGEGFTQNYGYGNYQRVDGNGGNGGGGGGGGFGGGKGGKGGKGGVSIKGSSISGDKIKGYDGVAADPGYGNGGDGGAGRWGLQGDGGLNIGLGGNGMASSVEQLYGNIGCGGGGGGGNGGAGGDGLGTTLGNGFGGAGGGGGGYGGGVLVIIADRIVYDYIEQPLFLVSGQLGGNGGHIQGTDYYGFRGKNGEGGLLVIEAPNYEASSKQWNLGDWYHGEHDLEKNNGGHGIVVGGPQKVFVNGNDLT